jgi:hypothetical protein
LPRPRPADDGGGGKSAQSILLIADLRFNWNARKK